MCACSPKAVAGWQLVQQVERLDQVAEFVEDSTGRYIASPQPQLIVLAQPEDVPGLVLDRLAEAFPTGR